jgi:hypothetical protein
MRSNLIQEQQSDPSRSKSKNFILGTTKIVPNMTGIQHPASQHRKEDFDVSKMYKPSLTLTGVRSQKSEAQRQTAGTLSRELGGT